MNRVSASGELAKKTDEIVALEERVLKLEEENDMQIREHESKMVHAVVTRLRLCGAVISGDDVLGTLKEQLRPIACEICHSRSDRTIPSNWRVCGSLLRRMQRNRRPRGYKSTSQATRNS